MLALNCGKYLQRRGTDLQRDRGHRHLAAGLFGLGSESRAQLLKFGNVGAVMLRDMRNRVPGFGRCSAVLRRTPRIDTRSILPHLRKIRKLRLREVSGARRRLSR